jgi:ornithine cyclodeaminase/alanine dehydrogenase-like protein (mu-crystallin family)
MTVRLLRAAELAKVCPMGDAISAVSAGFAALSSGQATVPLRPSVPLLNGAVAFTMPASLAGASCYSVKVVTVAPANARSGRPAVLATVVVGDAATGEVVALIDGTALTALRTGAAGGVAARELSREGASRAALFGAGAQARAQLLALAAVRPIQDVGVVARDPAHVSAFVAWAAAEPALRNVAVRGGPAREAVEGADIVVTATNSRTPVFEGRWLGEGVHLTAVGSFTAEMRELDDDALRGARLVVDQRAAALAESGELQGRRGDDLVELGEIVARRAVGRSNDRERTVFKSVGNAIQDLVVATLAYERARALGIGEEIAFP